jgi:hypothetical protein
MTANHGDPTMTTSKREFWLPTKPSTLIDTINRFAAATGSLGYAAAAHGADYNGHRAQTFPPVPGCKSHWHASYTWAGSHHFARGTFEECHRECRAWYDRQGAGGEVVASAETPEQEALLVELGFEPFSREIRDAHQAAQETWQHRAWRRDVRTGLRNERHMILEGELVNWPEDDEAGWDAHVAAAKAPRR